MVAAAPPTAVPDSDEPLLDGGFAAGAQPSLPPLASPRRWWDLHPRGALTSPSLLLAVANRVVRDLRARVRAAVRFPDALLRRPLGRDALLKWPTTLPT